MARLLTWWSMAMPLCLPFWALSPRLITSSAVPDEHPESLGFGSHTHKTLQSIDRLREWRPMVYRAVTL